MALSLSSTVYPIPGVHRNGNGGAGNGNGATWSVTITVNGRVLNPSDINAMSPSGLALLATDLVKGGLSVQQALALTGASPSYLNTALHLSDQQRQLIDEGRATLSQFHNAKKADRKIEVFLKRPGVAARVLKVLDRMTTPTLVAAE